MEAKALLAERPPETLPVPFPTRRGVATLFILGGGVTPQVMVDEYFRLAGGREARILHIPSATITFPDIPDKRDYYCEFYDPNPASFEFLHTYERAVADTAEFAKPLDEATGVWMGGGCQIRLADIFKDTAVHRGIRGVLERGGIVSGTSSGATIMSDRMIHRGYEELQFGHGFALYPRAMIDTHYTGRERQRRIARSTLLYPDHMGIGLDEKSALVVHGNYLGVMGLVGRSAYYHFADPETQTVRRYRLGVGEWIDLGVPARGADLAVVEARLQALRPADVLAAVDMVEPSSD
jgi:cyanophycinase